MSRYTGPKNRIARRFGVNIFGKGRNPMLHKQHPPGMHGAKRKKKSDFGLQIEERQKLKAVYGMLTQTQLKNAYDKALTLPGNPIHNFLNLLECRLDNIVYRLRFGSTIFAAQQLVSHGHILVNGKKVDRRSFIVRPGMVVELRPHTRSLQAVRFAQEQTNRELPPYLSLSEDACSGTLISVPQIEQVSLPLPINIHQVCEFLSHTS